MGLRKTFKRLMKKYVSDDLFIETPRGISFFRDVTVLLPKYNVDIVFDVGANVGQSVHELKKHFPNAYIHCFEPVSKTFARLQKNVKEETNVKCFKVALSNTTGQGLMRAEGHSSKNFLLDTEKNTQGVEQVLASGDKVSQEKTPMTTEHVETISLDNFCETNKIEYISYLKVDTEGADLDVLNGAQNMLMQQNIDFVEVESGMNPGNKYHVALEEFKEFLEKLDYFVFGIYEQVGEWPKKELHLRRANLVFISKKMIAKYKK